MSATHEPALKGYRKVIVTAVGIVATAIVGLLSEDPLPIVAAIGTMVSAYTVGQSVVDSREAGK